jgi:hypothetical protein
MAIHGSSLFLQRLRRYSEEFVSAVVERVPLCAGRLERLLRLRSWALPDTGQLLSHGQCDLWTSRAAYPIPAVLVRQQFNDADLSVKRQRGKDHGSHGDSQELTKNEFSHVPIRQNPGNSYCVM